VSTSVVGTATGSDKRRDGRGGAIKGWQGPSSDVLVHVSCEVEDSCHHFVRGEEVVCVERVDDTLFGMIEVAGARDDTEHGEAHVVRMEGNIAIDHPACLVAVVKGLTHEADVVCERLARAQVKHEAVEQRKRACKRATI
jgi:hypothetical protein